MFPLAGKDIPTSNEELQESINGALSEFFALNGSKGGASVSGGKYPSIKAVKINLDGAEVSIDSPPPRPKPVGKRQKGITVEKFDFSGEPIRYEKTKLNLCMSGNGLEFDFGHDKKGQALLILTNADNGKVEARITKKDLQELLLAAAELAAKQQGVTIQDLDLTLEAVGPRSVALDVRVKAKKLMMSGVVRVQGRLDIDDELNATLSGLSCTGEGMIGSAAAGFLQKKIQQYEGTEIPLMAFSLGDVALRDLKISVKDSISVSATFGKAA